MIGMKELKNNIVDQILYFVQELHKNKDSTGDFLHTVIYGPPGTGKTEIAKIMGQIYSKIGILSNGTFKKVTRSDLVAGYLGQTALKTREVIKESLGGVLFIDEAYSLGNPEKKDSFSKECIDTLCEALSDNKENLMVIIAGYEKELKDCFFSFNQGLDSRFTWRFKMDDYTHEDLYNIFLKKVSDIDWKIEETESFCKVATLTLENRELKFHDSIASATEANIEIDLVFANSSIQYTVNPMLTLKELLELNSKISFITRTPLSILDDTFEYFQFSLASENGPGILPKQRQKLVSYRCSAIKKADALLKFHEKYREVTVVYEGVWDFKKRKVGSFTVIGMSD
jgi:SpoVK/Ycf46/Vps4 family AAA+-type ATPase